MRTVWLRWVVCRPGLLATGWTIGETPRIAARGAVRRWRGEFLPNELILCEPMTRCGGRLGLDFGQAVEVLL